MKIDKSWYVEPKDKNYPTQKLAGGIVVRNDNGRLLVAFIKDKKFSKYLLAKGRIEKGESPLDAAKREVAEETGLDKLEFVKELGIKSRFTFDKTTWNTYHYFLFSTSQKSGVQNLEPEEKNYVLKWFDLDSIPPMLWPEQKDLIEENRELIKKLLNIS